MKISVVLEALTGKFETDMQRASKSTQKSMRDIQRSVKQNAKVVATAMSAAAVAIGGFVKQSLNAADEFAKMSQSIGVSVESLSALKFAAGQAGTEFETVTKGLSRLSRVAKDAVTGLTTAQRPFEQLGISITNTEGALRPVEDLLVDIADKFSTLKDGTTKAALAQELFGRSGVKLIPLLNEGRAGLQAFKDEAAALGLIIDTKTAKAAEVFNDNLDKLQGAMRGVFNTVAANLAPTLVQLTNEMVDSAKGSSALQDAARSLTTFLKILATTGAGVATVFTAIGTTLGGGAAVIGQFLKGNFKAARELDKQLLADVNAIGDKFAKRYEAIWNPKPITDFAKEVRTATGEIIVQNDKLAASAKKTADEQARALTSARDSLTGMIASQRQQIDTFGQGEAAVLKYRLTVGDLSDEVKLLGNEGLRYSQILQKQAMDTEALTRAQEAAKAATEALNQKQSEAAAVYEATRTPLEKLRAEIVRLNELRNTFANGKPLIDPETYARGVKQAQDAFDQIADSANDSFIDIEAASKRAAENMQDALADFFFDPFENGLKGLLKSFGDTLRRMAAELAASEVLRLITGGGGGAGNIVGNVIGSLFGGSIGARAIGGPVSANTPYMVGEKGPELMIPQGAGRIIPNRQLQGGGGNTVVVNVSTPDADSFRRNRSAIQNEMVNGLARVSARNG